MRQDLQKVFAVPQICPVAKTTQDFVHFADKVYEKGAIGKEAACWSIQF
jgi:hypothetical protein